MIKESITSMPFDNRPDSGSNAVLNPTTEKSRVMEIDDDYERRLQLGKYLDHTMITDESNGDKHWTINPIFEGEIDFSKGIQVESKGDYIVDTDNEKSFVVKNKTYNELVDMLDQKGIKWRKISPFSSFKEKRNAIYDKMFVTLVSNILPSCYKIETESVRYNVKEIGSGFYLKNDYLLTCAHVISKKRESIKDVSVFIIDDKKRYHAKVIDIDYDLDCALIYCDSVKHGKLSYKPSSSISVGEEILCVGSPYGYDNNVSKGILSSKDRDIKQEKKPYFFMDLSVYPGSSGGPVIDVFDGKVFGIAAVIIESVGNYGLNAGIPIEYCVDRFKQIFNKGS